MSMEPLAEKALCAVEKGELKIIPERFEKVHVSLLHWRTGDEFKPPQPSFCLYYQYLFGASSHLSNLGAIRPRERSSCTGCIVGW